MQWMNHLWSPTPGVAVSWRAVSDLVSRHFPEGKSPPSQLPFDFTVIVQDKPFDVLEHRGNLRCVSPCEQAFATLVACSRDLDKGDQIVREWRRCFQSVTVNFVHQSFAKAGLVAFQLRENPLIDAEHVTWTTLQRVQMVIRERNALGLNTVPKVVAHFKEIKLAQSSEQLSASFIEAAMVVEKRIFAHQPTKTILEEWDNLCGMNGPFNSVFKLQAIVERSKTIDNIHWVIASLSDSVHMGILTPGSVTVGALRAHLCHLAMLKQGLLHHLLYTWLDQGPFSSLAKTTCRARLATHEEVRRSITPCPIAGAPAVDMSWASTQQISTMKFVQLVESVVYGDAYDVALKIGVKNSKPADVVADYPSIKEDTTLHANHEPFECVGFGPFRNGAPLLKTCRTFIFRTL